MHRSKNIGSQIRHSITSSARAINLRRAVLPHCYDQAFCL
jgi:hypothetical protein